MMCECLPVPIELMKRNQEQAYQEKIKDLQRQVRNLNIRTNQLLLHKNNCDALLDDIVRQNKKAAKPGGLFAHVVAWKFNDRELIRDTNINFNQSVSRWAQAITVLKMGYQDMINRPLNPEIKGVKR